MASYRFFFKMAASQKSTSRFSFSDCTHLRKRKFTCLPNFNEIYQCTAEIKLLLVSENGRPPYWNSISGFDFGLICVIRVSFCIGLPNFVQIELPSARSYDVISIFHDGGRQPYCIGSG